VGFEQEDFHKNGPSPSIGRGGCPPLRWRGFLKERNMRSRLLAVVCSLIFTILAPCVYAQIKPAVPARPSIDDYHFVFGQLDAMTRFTALISTIAWCTAIGLFMIFLGAVVNLSLSVRIRPERPKLNAVGNQSDEHALRISGSLFDWLRKVRHVFPELNGRNHVGRRIAS
jgi:hypothetical protein